MPEINTSSYIKSVDSLTKVIGKTPGPRNLKVIEHLDIYAQRWLTASTCVFATVFYKDENTVHAMIGGDFPGFVKTTRSTLLAPRRYLDDVPPCRKGDAFGSIFLVPGLNETMRVNGVRVKDSKAGLEVKVTECYLHCAKAPMRSNFWNAPNKPLKIFEATEFSVRAQCMFLATANSSIEADISPKGDPVGKLLKIKNNKLYFADRPGNRRVDSFRNMLTQSNVSLIILVKGCAQIMKVSGTVCIIQNSKIQKAFCVSGKPPKLVTDITIDNLTISASLAVARAALLTSNYDVPTWSAVDIFKTHIKLNKCRGVAATIAKKVAIAALVL